MGIVVPRPQMRGKEARTIEANIRRHIDLTQKYQAEGMSKEAASRKSYEEIKSGR
jgi:hypothetical protein